MIEVNDLRTEQEDSLYDDLKINIYNKAIDIVSKDTNHRIMYIESLNAHNLAIGIASYNNIIAGTCKTEFNPDNKMVHKIIVSRAKVKEGITIHDTITKKHDDPDRHNFKDKWKSIEPQTED